MYIKKVFTREATGTDVIAYVDERHIDAWRDGPNSEVHNIAISMYVIDKHYNSVIKCRGELEDIFDEALLEPDF